MSQLTPKRISVSLLLCCSTVTATTLNATPSQQNPNSNTPESSLKQQTKHHSTAKLQHHYQFNVADLFTLAQQLSQQTGIAVIISPELANTAKPLVINASYTLEELLNTLQKHYKLQFTQHRSGIIIQSVVQQQKRVSTAKITSTQTTAVIKNTLPTPEKISVTGSYSKSLQSAASVKRYGDSVVDAIIAEDIGKFPAQNIAEALQRVTGVSIVRDRGEGVYVRVRGLGSNFQVTTLNGNTMAVNENVRTSGQFGRQFRFDTLPAELVSAVEVIKSPTADLDEGAIGGTVNIKTFRPLQLGETKFSASAQASHAELADKTNPRMSGLANWVNDDKTFGVLVSAAYAKRSVRQDRALNFGWTKASLENQYSTQHNDTILTPASIRPTLELEDRKRLGISGALQWQPSSTFKLHADMLYVNQKVNYQEFSYSADYQLNKLVANSLIFRDNALIGGSTLDGSVQIGRESAGIRDENLAFNLELNQNILDWQLAATLFHSSADSHDEDPIRRTRLRKNNGVAFDFWFPTLTGQAVPTLTYHNADLLNPAHWPGRQLEWRTMQATDTEQALKLDASYLLSHALFSKLSLGIKLRERERDYSRRDLTLTKDIAGEIFPAHYFEHFPANQFLASSNGNLPRQWLIPNEHAFWGNYPTTADLNTALTDNDLRNTYTIRERINAVYAMLQLDTLLAKMPLTGNVGLRLATTKQLSSGYATTNNVTSPVSFNSRYTDVLPALNLALELNTQLVSRFAAAKVVTRPDLQDIAPRLTLNSGDLLTAIGGNPYLKPFEAWQYDLTLEYYPKEHSQLTAGIFHKNITTFIQTRKSTLVFNEQPYQLTSKTNGSHASVSGAELAYQQLFYTRSGMWGLQANYTWTTSRALYRTQTTSETDNTGGIAEFYGRLEDVAKNSYNLALFYETPTLAARLNYSWRDDVLNQIGINSEVTENRAAFGSLDASLTYSLNTHFSVFAEGINLTDQAEQEFVAGNEFRSYTYYGRTFSVGIRLNF